ncbi:hypothetical protein ACFL15_02510 [Patescibacteria group bacterium]
MPNCHFRFPKLFLGILLTFIFSFTNYSEVYSKVLINEVSSFDASGDWIELFSDEDVDISGWILRDNASTKIKTLDVGTLIGPSTSEFLVIDASNRLNVDEDIVKLLETDDLTLIDQLSYGETKDICSPQSGESIGRLPDGSSSLVRFSIQTKSSSNIDQQNPCPTPTPSSSPSPTPTATSILTPTPIVTPTPIITSTPTKSPTPKPTKTPIHKPTEKALEQEVLGVQDQKADPSPTKEPDEGSEKPKVNILAILFITFGIIFVGISVFAFIKQKGLNKLDEKNQEII